jgi:penicillin-binding protein A
MNRSYQYDYARYARSQRFRRTPRKRIKWTVRAILVFLLFMFIRCTIWSPVSEDIYLDEEYAEDEYAEGDDLAEEKIASKEFHEASSSSQTKQQSSSASVDTVTTSTSEWDYPGAMFQKDPLLGQRIHRFLARYRPEHAFVLISDIGTNEIIAWGQRTDSAQSEHPTFLPRTTFPAASLIKTVTAAAAFEKLGLTPETPIPDIGRRTTLYRRQLVAREDFNGSTITLRQAYGSSANPAFGILGLELGQENLIAMGSKMGFETRFPKNIPNTSIYLPPDTGFGLAEIASGYTRATTISPLHSSAIVRAIVTGGHIELPWSTVIPEPFASSDRVRLRDSQLDSTTYEGLMELMRTTLTSGTARRGVRRTITERYRNKLEIGGKTGSLTGFDPRGRYDWFAGYARSTDNPEHGIIITVMQVHGPYRNLPTTELTGLMINAWAGIYLRNSNR